MSCRFSLRWMMFGVGVLCFVAALLVSLIRANDGSHITVSVVNETDEPLSKVRLAFTGGSCTMERIQPGKKVSWEIRSAGESDLTLMYFDSTGVFIKLPVDVYFEGGYWGTLDLFVTDDGLKTVNCIESGPALPFGR